MPPTDDLCGADRPERVPHKKVGKRPFAEPVPTAALDAAVAATASSDLVTNGNSAILPPAATSGADNGKEKQNPSASQSTAKKPKKVLPQPFAATCGADNERTEETPVLGKKPKSVPPLPIAATCGADNNRERKMPASCLLDTSFEYNSRKLQLLTLPGFQGLPARLLDKLLPRPASLATNFLKDRQRFVLVLDEHTDAESSLLFACKACQPEPAELIFEMSIQRDEELYMLNDNFFKELCEACCAGRTAGIIGSPPWRSWSVLRHFPQSGSPDPVRDRSATGCWGSDSLRKTPQTSEEKKEVDRESLGLLRQFYLLHLSSESESGPGFYMDHPADPMVFSKTEHAKTCASWWSTKHCGALSSAYDMGVLSFIQGQMGADSDDWTSSMTNLDLAHLHTLPLLSASAGPATEWPGETWSTYKPSRTLGLRVAISNAMAAHLGKKNTEASDRPRTAALDLAPNSKVEFVQVDNRNRPLRDGGGKTSPGRVKPAIRRPSALNPVTKILLGLAKASTVHALIMNSVNKGGLDKNHPVPQEFIRECRTAVGSHYQWPQSIYSDIPSGQPFLLHMVSGLGKEAGDCDWAYPLDLVEGVPLGVDSPPLPCEHVWPTKEEMAKCSEDQEPEEPRSHDNYTSATEFEDEIEATFEEEKEMGLTLGPMDLETAA